MCQVSVGCSVEAVIGSFVLAQSEASSTSPIRGFACDGQSDRLVKQALSVSRQP
jgi:hypothetical protein